MSCAIPATLKAVGLRLTCRAVIPRQQNHPNPFNPTTVISFQLQVNSDVTLTIFNTNGQLVRQLLAGEMNAGRYSIVWDATNERGERVASGV
jgi:flagellar hook assembly protein FlgD